MPAQPVKIVYAFRHGQTDWNQAGRIQGHLDIPLNDFGRGQSRKLGEVLRRFPVHAILTSDLSRARETAEIAAGVAGYRDVRIVADERLREIHLGKLQGLTREEIEVQHGLEFSKRLRSDPLNDADVALIGSESGEAVFRRASAAIFSLLREPGVDAIGVSTHGGVLRRLIESAEGSGGFPGSIANTLVYPLRVDLSRERLVYQNHSVWN